MMNRKKDYKDLDKYLTRMEQMQNLENEKSRETDIMKTLYAVSLQQQKHEKNIKVFIR